MIARPLPLLRLALPLLALGALSACQPEMPAETVIPSTEVVAVHTPPADYPLEQACADVGGHVVMKVVVGPEGKATDVEVIQGSGVPELDAAAQAGIREWEFRPATRRGQQVSQTIQVPMTFRPPEEPSELCLERERKNANQL